MPLQDVTVTINIQKPTALIGLGTPLILANKAGAQSYKEYFDLETLKVDFIESTNAYKVAAQIFNQGSNKPEKIAIATYDLSATEPIVAADTLEKYFYKDWYFVLLDTGEVAEQIAISDIVEEKGLKITAYGIDSVDDATQFLTNKYDRTILFEHDDLTELPHAGLIGAVGSKPVGSVTWKFKSIKGVTPQDITDTELADIHRNGAIAYVTKGGNAETSEGFVVSGEFIDVIHAKDWIKLNIEARVQKLFSSNDKVPFSNAGIALIETAVENVLLEAYRNNMIAETPDGLPSYSITTLKASEVDAVDRAKRIYKGLSFVFELKNAIHSAEIAGEIIL